MVLPGVQESVLLATPNGGRIPARVLEQGEGTLLLAITVPIKPLTPAQLQDMVLEHHSERGRIRLRGSFAVEDPAEPDVLRMREPRSIEVVQERHYVRLQVARPVVVESVRDRSRIETYTVDVSGGGMLLAGPDTLKRGDEIGFRLNIASAQPTVNGTGRVVRVDPMGRRAIVFESIADLDRRRLVRFIFECQRAERQRGLRSEGRGER
jgi:hypothetical protein